MPIAVKMNEMLDKINAGAFGGGQSAGEVHDFVTVKNIEEHRGQTGKLSLKLTLVTKDGKSFNGYLPATDKTTESTDKKVGWLGKEVGADIVKIGNAVAEDEDVNTPIEFTLAFGVKIGKKIDKAAKKPVVFVDRVKEGEFWNTKITFGKKEEKEAVPEEPVDSIFTDVE